jgi:ElaB/YqjD/DUF883 family membrane-anchored ribosome-binding protein
MLWQGPRRANTVISPGVQTMDTTTTPPEARSANVLDERLSLHLKNLVEGVEHLLKDTAHAGDQTVEATRERLRQELAQLRTRMADFEAGAVAQLKSAARQTDHAVHEHPYAAMGAAALSGLLLGFLLARR